jgi:hypothetical protein
MDNPTAIDAAVTSCLLLQPGGPSGSDEFDHVSMTPTAVSLDGFRSPSRLNAVHQSLPATDQSFGRMRSATEPQVGRDRGEMQTRYALTLIQNALIGAIWRNWRKTGALQRAAYAPSCFSLMKVLKSNMQRL